MEDAAGDAGQLFVLFLRGRTARWRVPRGPQLLPPETLRRIDHQWKTTRYKSPFPAAPRGAIGLLDLPPGALLAALVAAVSTGGLPGSITSLAACVPIANAMGDRLAVLPVLLAVELVPDVFRTLGNVTADLAVTAILSRDRAR